MTPASSMNAALSGRPALALSKCTAKLNASGGGSTGLPVIGVSLVSLETALRAALLPRLAARRFTPAGRAKACSPRLDAILCLTSPLGARLNHVKQHTANRRRGRGELASKFARGRGTWRGSGGLRGAVSACAWRAGKGAARAAGADAQGLGARHGRLRAALGQSRIWRRQRFDPGPFAGIAGAAMLARGDPGRLHHPVAGLAQ